LAYHRTQDVTNWRISATGTSMTWRPFTANSSCQRLPGWHPETASTDVMTIRKDSSTNVSERRERQRSVAIYQRRRRPVLSKR